MSDTYSVCVKCTNCGHHGNIEIKKGTPVASTLLCPNCGCSSAHKDNSAYTPNPTRPFPRPIPKRDEEYWPWKRLPGGSFYKEDYFLKVTC